MSATPKTSRLVALRTAAQRVLAQKIALPGQPFTPPEKRGVVITADEMVALCTRIIDLQTTLSSVVDDCLNCGGSGLVVHPLGQEVCRVCGLARTLLRAAEDEVTISG
jgi:hypothetical protein